MSGASLILSFDTATLGGSVCVARGEQVLASMVGDSSVSHSSTLLRDLDRTLELAGVSIRQVELFAAAAGPGSFTGLRIGVATVKALAITLNRPCFGIPTLQAVAHSAGPSRATVAVLPAGRGEVFAQLFSVSTVGVVKEHDDPAHLPPRMMIEKYGAIPNLRWVGQGALAHRETIKAYAASKAIEFAESPRTTEGWVLPEREENLARDIAALALQRFQNGQLESAESLKAIYVRPSDAELKKNVSE